MDKNVAVIDINDYNELRDFKEGIFSNNTYFIHSGRFISKDETLQLMNKNIDDLTDKYNMLKSERYFDPIQQEKYELQNKIADLEYKISKLESTITQLSNSDIWEFKKWRKQYKATKN